MQWVQCDLRKLDMSVLGKFAVVMADPPWDIHMEVGVQFDGSNVSASSLSAVHNYFCARH